MDLQRWVVGNEWSLETSVAAGAGSEMAKERCSAVLTSGNDGRQQIVGGGWW